MIALLLLAGPIVLGAHFGLGFLPAVGIAVALNFAIRNLKRSQFEHGAPINVRPYFVLAMLEFAAFLFWLRYGRR